MNRAIIQVPVSPKLRKEAEKQATRQGFTSLQEAIRLFLNKLASKEIRVKLEEVVYRPVEDGILLYDIGTHNQVYNR